MTATSLKRAAKLLMLGTPALFHEIGGSIASVSNHPRKTELGHSITG